MKIGWSWLTEYCDPGLGPAELAERLSMTGTEVERLGHNGAPSGEGYVVGKVLSAEKHPDADRLSVCSVDTGEAEPRTIVCGAPNVAAGQTVAVITPGALMPGGEKLGKAKLRGVESNGMILSEPEMGLSEDGAGIATLDTDAAPGTPLSEVLPISEPVLELEITPNRPDCLGVYGVAREVHAITGAELGPEPWADDAPAEGEGEASDYASVTVDVPDPELCPRFTARVFTGVEIGPSPLWLKARLTAAGQRPINNVVDITNYVMLLTGQPLHAFDLDKVPGGEIIVRTAREGERMTTLDDVERELDPGIVLVCDREQPSGIAGVMGGQVSEVSESTTRVLLEVATWNGRNILETSGKLGLRSEASTRFEKQLHPELAMRAQHVASKLMVELCGAKLVPGTIDADQGLYEPFALELRIERQTELLGMEIDLGTSCEYLRRLGYGADAGDGAATVTVPGDRHFDTTREVDLIEEVARVHGLDEHLPATLPSRRDAVGGLTPQQRLARRLEDELRDLGLDEVVTWHFVDPGVAAELGLEGTAAAPITIHNPLSSEGSAMRTTLLAGLLTAASHNVARGAPGAALFESGRVFFAETAPQGGGPAAGDFAGHRSAPARESHRIAALLCGTAAAGWREAAGPRDFYAAKGLVEAICAVSGAEPEFTPAEPGFLYPGRAARIGIGGADAGWVGELHPRVAEGRDLPAGAAFELDLAALADAAGAVEIYADVTTYPAAYEDIAVVAGAEVPAGEVRSVVLEAGGELLRSAEVFDVYEGEQVGEGRRSLALRLEFRAPDRTLTDAEVAERREAIVAALGRIGGSLRG